MAVIVDGGRKVVNTRDPPTAHSQTILDVEPMGLGITLLLPFDPFEKGEFQGAWEQQNGK